MLSAHLACIRAATKGNVPGLVSMPALFWGTEWAKSTYGDQYKDVFEVCELRQYQPGFKGCEEGVWVEHGDPAQRVLVPIADWTSWFERGLYTGPHTYTTSVHNVWEFSTCSL